MMCYYLNVQFQGQRVNIRVFRLNFKLHLEKSHSAGFSYVTHSKNVFNYLKKRNLWKT